MHAHGVEGKGRYGWVGVGYGGIDFDGVDGVGVVRVSGGRDVGVG